MLLLIQTNSTKIVDQTSKFQTAHYTITITTHCQNGQTGCDHVTYKSLSSTGKSITLQGEEVETCADEANKPCRSLGYRFKDGDVIYSLPEDMMDGPLIVTKNNKEILREAGHWLDWQ